MRYEMLRIALLFFLFGIVVGYVTLRAMFLNDYNSLLEELHSCLNPIEVYP